MGSYSPLHRVPGEVLAGVVGVALGLGASVLGYFQAQAAVAVRPNLADVGFIDAVLTNHGTDWLFYHYPFPTAIATAVIPGIVLFVALRWFWA